MKRPKRWAARVKTPRGRPDWYTSDQRLLAEIRDLLIEILNESYTLELTNGVRLLERRMAALQAAVEDSLTARAAIYTPDEEAMPAA